MERPKHVNRCVGSKAVTQIIRPSILLVVVLLALLDMASSARPLQNPSVFQSSYHLEGSAVDAPLKIFDVESNIGVVPAPPSPHHELYRGRVLTSCNCPNGDDCVGPHNHGGSPPGCG